MNKSKKKKMESEKSKFTSTIVSEQFTRIFASVVILIGMLVLIGWYSSLMFLTRFSINEVPMAPSTAYGFISLSIVLWFYFGTQKTAITRNIAIVSAVIVICLSCLVVVTNMFNYYANWEHAFIKIPETQLSMQLGHMSVVTAVLFIISGFAFLFLISNRKVFKTFSIILTLIIFIIGFILLLAYGFGAPFFYFDNFIPPAFLTVLSFFLLAIAFIAASNKNTLFVKTIWETSTSAKLLRIFLPTTIAIAVIESLIVIRIIPLIDIHPAFGVSIVTLTVVVVVIVVILILSKNIGKSLETALINLRESEEKIRITEKNLQNTFDLSPSIIAKANMNIGCFTQVNKAITKILGYKVEEFTSKPYMEFVHPDDRQSTIDIATEQLKGNEVTFFENRYLCKDGSYKWIAWHGTKPDNNGIVTTIGSDINERKIAEIKAIENQKLYEGLVQSSHNLIWKCDLKGNFTFLNSAWEDSHGYKVEEMLGRPFSDFQRPEVFELDSIEFKKHLDRGYLKGYETTHIIKDGTEISLIFNALPLFDFNGEITGTQGTAFDITELKQTELELINAKERAEESDRLKSSFLANMSHEIRTPMNGILGFTDLLKDASLSIDNQNKYINIIKNSGNRLLNTVNDIIEISKIESGEITISKSEVDLVSYLDTLVTFFNNEAKKKGIKISTQNVIDNNELFIQTDKTKLDSILSNLIKNAIKYTDKGTIEVGFKIEKSQLLFSCKDSGIGIPKDRRFAIFNRFEQADIEDKHAHQGSGLGLAIVKSYVEMMNGKIWVDSEKGKGSTFYVSLPYKKEKKRKQIIPKEVNSSNSGLKNLNILIVEDEEYSSMFLSEVIKDITKKIITARNGIEAIGTCKKDSGIDLILMDIKMPVMDGIEATKKIREFNKDVIIIAQTAYALEGDKVIALNAGCNDYISKPIKKEMLFKLINKYF